jgi:hypothetical protein
VPVSEQRAFMEFRDRRTVGAGSAVSWDRRHGSMRIELRYSFFFLPPSTANRK